MPPSSERRTEGTALEANLIVPSTEGAWLARVGGIEARGVAGLAALLVGRARLLVLAYDCVLETLVLREALPDHGP